jgi:predicted nucleotidyltransferase
MIISKDISNKIESQVVEVLALMKDVAEKTAIPFFLVGARARDIFFSAIFEIQTRRATLDVDIAVRVSSWDKVSELLAHLLMTGEVEPDSNLQFRFKHTNGAIIDIVPFGEVEYPPGKVQWPSDDAIMTTIGFEEAFNYSMIVRVGQDPPIDVRICTPPSLVILKLSAWNEKHPERSKDAIDIDFILRSYIEAGNSERLYAEDIDITQEEGYDFDLASARLLGRDMAKIASISSLALVTEILERETAENSDFKLITDMNRGQPSFADRFDQTRTLLTQLLRGIKEPPRIVE